MDALGNRSGKAVFLDRDGTIIEDRHYLSDPAEVVLLPNAGRALTMLRDEGFTLFLFTNQSGVGRGMFTLDAVHRCNERMIELLGLTNPVFAETCIAPERPDEQAIYRKPSPRFIDECVVKYALDRSQCWMVGDKPGDVEAGVNAGIRSAMVGNGSTAVNAVGVCQCKTLYDFAGAVTTGAL